MTKAEVQKMFEGGKPVLVVEFRSSKAERIRWRDKESKAIMEAPILRHSCEAADGTPYIVNERVADTFDVEKFQSPIGRGQRVVLEFAAMTVERGLTHFQGKLTPLLDK